MKYIFIFLSVIYQVQACWFYSKQTTIEKIRAKMNEIHLSQLSKTSLTKLAKTLPAPISWAVNVIGIENAYKDCDINRDNIITLEEMSESYTCLDSCTKLAVVNSVL